jgi:hypothetical protein
VRALERAQLAQVQLLSEASAKAEDAAREAAFVASARLEPVATFSDTSTFLVRREGGGVCACVGLLCLSGSARMHCASARACKLCA